MARIQHWAYCEHCRGEGCRFCGGTGEITTWCDPHDNDQKANY
jgi:hypothetical protein